MRPQRLDVLTERLVLLCLGDIQVVDIDLADHVSIVGHLESLGSHGIGLGGQRQSPPGLEQLSRGEVRLLLHLFQGQLPFALGALQFGLGRPDLAASGTPLDERDLDADGGLARLEQVAIGKVELRRGRVEAEACLHCRPEPVLEPGRTDRALGLQFPQANLTDGGAIGQRLRHGECRVDGKPGHLDRHDQFNRRVHRQVQRQSQCSHRPVEFEPGAIDRVARAEHGQLTLQQVVLSDLAHLKTAFIQAVQRVVHRRVGLGVGQGAPS